MAKILLGSDFLTTLCNALGLEKVKRIVLDAEMDNAVIVYVEMLGDEKLLDIATSLNGVDIQVRAVKDMPANKTNES